MTARTAVLLGGEATAVPVARSLGRAGIPVQALGGQGDPVRRSRHVDEFVDVGTGESFQERCLEWLMGPAPSSVVLPCSDEGLELVARNRAALDSPRARRGRGRRPEAAGRPRQGAHARARSPARHPGTPHDDGPRRGRAAAGGRGDRLPVRPQATARPRVPPVLRQQGVRRRHLGRHRGVLPPERGGRHRDAGHGDGARAPTATTPATAIWTSTARTSSRSPSRSSASCRSRSARVCTT